MLYYGGDTQTRCGGISSGGGGFQNRTWRWRRGRYGLLINAILHVRIQLRESLKILQEIKRRWWFHGGSCCRTSSALIL